ncbi:MAG: hypothetical protein PHG00_15260 [Methylococcales bacterium]|nr:hypothetical protein [Methylococcales bacterium]
MAMRTLQFRQAIKSNDEGVNHLFSPPLTLASILIEDDALKGDIGKGVKTHASIMKPVRLTYPHIHFITFMQL